jgi:hypothetical protein
MLHPTPASPGKACRLESDLRISQAAFTSLNHLQSLGGASNRSELKRLTTSAPNPMRTREKRYIFGWLGSISASVIDWSAACPSNPHCD